METLPCCCCCLCVLVGVSTALVCVTKQKNILLTNSSLHVLLSLHLHSVTILECIFYFPVAFPRYTHYTSHHLSPLSVSDIIYTSRVTFLNMWVGVTPDGASVPTGKWLCLKGGLAYTVMKSVGKESYTLEGREKGLFVLHHDGKHGKRHV